MFITLKTLQQKVFKVESELSESVGSLKEKIQDVGKSDHNGDYPKDKQKLIFQVSIHLLSRWILSTYLLGKNIR